MKMQCWLSNEWRRCMVLVSLRFPGNAFSQPGRISSSFHPSKAARLLQRREHFLPGAGVDQMSSLFSSFRAILYITSRRTLLWLGTHPTCWNTLQCLNSRPGTKLPRRLVLFGIIFLYKIKRAKPIGLPTWTSVSVPYRSQGTCTTARKRYSCGKSSCRGRTESGPWRPSRRWRSIPRDLRGRNSEADGQERILVGCLKLRESTGTLCYHARCWNNEACRWLYLVGQRLK